MPAYLYHDMASFGEMLAELRRQRDLSQDQLAKLAGLSQASISRLESSGETPSDVRILRKLATALQEDLSLLLPERFVEEVEASRDQRFTAFCPNPLCDRNDIEKRDGKPYVVWRSKEIFDPDAFDDFNYCGACGTELVKDCPKCGRRIGLYRGLRFCITCGERLTDRPTPAEWVDIEKRLGLRISEDDIPF